MKTESHLQFICALWIRGTCLAPLAALTSVALPAQAAVTEAWIQRYSAPNTNSDDRAIKVVIDASGDLIATGTTDDHTTGKDFLTIKYSGANGSIIWQRRYDGSDRGGDDAPQAAAVDASGNVVVTGYSQSTSNREDFYTAKYAGVDGALLWERRYNGPANHNDRANGVAVDGEGNVVVTGASYATGGWPDFYTAKYASADGAVIWEHRYNGLANWRDAPSALALDAGSIKVHSG
jgi:fibronectin-binding autotransporter adhesin